jgi:hypothetical protein
MPDEPIDLISLGIFSPPDAETLLAALVEAGMAPEMEIDDGIRNVNVLYGSGGHMARIEVFVPPASHPTACAIRDQYLKLTGQV